MTIEEMKAVDIRTVDRGSLAQRDCVRIDEGAPRGERVRQYVSQIRNPYCYLDGKTAVKLSFPDTERTMEDCIRSYLGGL